MAFSSGRPRPAGVFHPFTSGSGSRARDRDKQKGENMHKHKKSVARAKPGRVDDLAGDVASLIKDRCFFPDQVRFWTIQPLDKRLLHRVGEHCLGRFHLWRPAEKDRYWMRHRGWKYCYHMNQPTPKAQEILSREMSPPDQYEWRDYLINYIEFAVELVVDNWNDRDRPPSFRSFSLVDRSSMSLAKPEWKGR